MNKLKKEDDLRLLLLTDPPGTLAVPALSRTLVSIHVGPSVQVGCRRGGQTHRGLAVHGDIDLIPAQTPSVWQLAEKDTAFVLSLSPGLLQRVSAELELDPQRVEIRNRFQMRDPHLENIGWALKAELESGYANGKLFLDSLAIAVTTRLIRCYSAQAPLTPKQPGSLSGRKLKQVLSFIEDNLSQELSLNEIAANAGLSASHFKQVFRTAVGLPVHQYVIRRRVERARTLLRESDLAISQIALETGFAHQSHLAHHLRRAFGVSPQAMRKLSD